jgi:hypothetical protein
MIEENIMIQSTQREQKDIYVANFDIHIKRFLTKPEIQTIANMMHNFDTWSEREVNKAILTLKYGTNMTDQEIQNMGPDLIFESGLMDIVYENIHNIKEIDECLNYTESIERSLTQIVKVLPQIQKVLEKANENKK